MIIVKRRIILNEIIFQICNALFGVIFFFFSVNVVRKIKKTLGKWKIVLLSIK